MPMTRRTLVAVVLALGPLVPGCLPPSDGCEPLTTRCNGPIAEICGGDERWGTILDCNEVAAQSGGEWVCCAYEDETGETGHTCLTPDECPKGSAP